MTVGVTNGALGSLAFCWRLERGDGAGLALTSSDRDVDYGGIRYRSSPGMTPAAVTRSLGLDSDGGETSGVVSADSLTEEDLLLGRWTGASVTLLAVDWANPAQSVPLLGGELGEISVAGDSFSAELLGAASKLSATPCPSTSAECRAELGDRQCRVDLAGRSVRAEVISAVASRLELDRVVDPTMLLGRLRFLSGRNCGTRSTILAVDGPTVTLRDRPRISVEPGCVVEIREGCDKSFATCVSRFANGINFRGEPYLPGTDLLTSYPGR